MEVMSVRCMPSPFILSSLAWLVCLRDEFGLLTLPRSRMERSAKMRATLAPATSSGSR